LPGPAAFILIMYKTILVVKKANSKTGDDVYLNKMHVYILYYYLQGFRRAKLKDKIPGTLGTYKLHIQELYLYTGVRYHNAGALGGWVGEHNIYHQIKEIATKKWSETEG